MNTLYTNCDNVVPRSVVHALKHAVSRSVLDALRGQGSGLPQVEEFDQILRFICSRGIWEKAYLQFLEDAKIELPEQARRRECCVAMSAFRDVIPKRNRIGGVLIFSLPQVLEKFWNYLNEGEKNPGLVPAARFCSQDWRVQRKRAEFRGLGCHSSQP